ncbi:hypothetical protein GQ55_5G497800 [Panicum hallii var. hallii]|uniref:Uncharacterized protein n=1 Tax=Panicum hallii var. hallii TaxID=1504633 RepID=A0A2T7DRU0_9POAL|nr:hypothetical protein GQ55_5G497800 [Panicum hallii var. hallii]
MHNGDAYRTRPARFLPSLGPRPRSRDVTPAITNAWSRLPSRQSGGHVAGRRASPTRVSAYGTTESGSPLPSTYNPPTRVVLHSFSSENARSFSVLLGT